MGALKKYAAAVRYAAAGRRAFMPLSVLRLQRRIHTTEAKLSDLDYTVVSDENIRGGHTQTD